MIHRGSRHRFIIETIHNIIVIISKISFSDRNDKFHLYAGLPAGFDMFWK